jgi:hypothetical protein
VFEVPVAAVAMKDGSLPEANFADCTRVSEAVSRQSLIGNAFITLRRAERWPSLAMEFSKGSSRSDEPAKSKLNLYLELASLALREVSGQ